MMWIIIRPLSLSGQGLSLMTNDRNYQLLRTKNIVYTVANPYAKGNEDSTFAYACKVCYVANSDFDKTLLLGARMQLP